MKSLSNISEFKEEIEDPEDEGVVMVGFKF